MSRRRPLRPEDALARAVLDRAVGLRRGESVAIEAWSHSLPWARSFVVEARRRGAFPTLIVEDEAAFFRSLEQLGSAAWSAAPSGARNTGADVHVYFGGPEAFPRLLGLPAPDLDAFLDRHQRNGLRPRGRLRPRAVRLTIGDASPTAAARYGVDASAWRSELLKGSLIDPRTLEASAHRLLRSLAHGRRLRVRHSNGTDLTVTLAPLTPYFDVGRTLGNSRAGSGRIPSGILLLRIRDGSAEGTWEANRPAYDRFAVPPAAVGGRFEFRRGRLTEFAFDQGGAPFEAAYALAGRGRDRPIALTLGLNPAISRAPEVVELGLGTTGLLLGDAPYPSRDPRSGLSFLAALAGADIEVDGQPWLVGGLPRSPMQRPSRRAAAVRR